MADTTPKSPFDAIVESSWTDPEVAALAWTMASLASVGALVVALLTTWWWAALVPVGYAVMAVRAFRWLRETDAASAERSRRG